MLSQSQDLTNKPLVQQLVVYPGSEAPMESNPPQNVATDNPAPPQRLKKLPTIQGLKSDQQKFDLSRTTAPENLKTNNLAMKMR